MSALRQLVAYTQLEDGQSQSFRTRAYEKAIDAIVACPDEIGAYSLAELKAMDGIGDSTARKIIEFSANGSIGKVERLKAKFPPSMLDLMRIPGLGPKTVLALQKHLGVTDVDGLKTALSKEQLRTLPGLGIKSEQKIAESIELLGLHSDATRRPIYDAMQIARRVMSELGRSGDVVSMEYAGSLRRLSETIGDIDILVTSDQPKNVVAAFLALPGVTAVLGSGGTKASVVIDDSIQVDLRVVSDEAFGAALMYFTGSKGHNIILRQRSLNRGLTLNEYSLSSVETGDVLAAKTESEIYAELGLQWITPEVREGTSEIAAADDGALPAPVRVTDIRGDLHVHTSWSGDGRSSLAEMLDAVVERGLEYVAITDHAEDLAINGLSRERMKQQAEELDMHRERLPQLTILHGVELNIGADGSVDYDPDFLEMFDVGVASVHSHFDLEEGAQTERLLTALANPAVTVLGHPTGRKIGRRPGIRFDANAVFDAAAATATALEINCSLHRLDLPAAMLRKAVDVQGVMFTISTDSHRVAELENIRWGVSQARKGWVPRERVLNSLPKHEFLSQIG
ncbi:MAG: DNA polymerase/3'-5' exonuclease PolX [Actinomycetia bacterium]|nr:DNA polymerase/3'-5' exonuclease PolX [Actinomycetes bacterium]